eukprot:scaffold4452_cov40-Cyclotella_meneghiniana.AAC.1
MQPAINHLTAKKYRDEDIVFIPFSSRKKWLVAHPFAVPSLECDGKGNICITPRLAASSARGDSLQPKKRKRGGSRFCKSSVLTDDLRDELHIQIFKYFCWLFTKLLNVESTANGRQKLSSCGFTVLGIQTLLSTFKSVLPILNNQPLSTNNHEMTEENLGEECDVPFLEQGVEENLARLMDGSKSESVAYDSERYDFDVMLQKLAQYKSEIGNCNVPQNYKQDPRLGKWVQKIREKKKELDFQVPVNSGNRTVLHLTEERIRCLNELGFEWIRQGQTRISWEERYKNLVDFHQTHGEWPKRGSLADWARKQRSLYAARDINFMNKRFSLLNDVGFDWDPTGVHKAKVLKWEDGFEQLTKFGQIHGHFNVPLALVVGENSCLYRWVQLLHVNGHNCTEVTIDVDLEQNTTVNTDNTDEAIEDGSPVDRSAAVDVSHGTAAFNANDETMRHPTHFVTLAAS